MAESTSQQSRPETHGSQTLTVNSTSNVPEASTTESASDSREGTPSSVGVLRLRGGPVRRNHVAWSSETVDNEGLGKKKSKICCIYHKPRKFDESSSESDDSSDDEQDSCCGHASSRAAGQSLRGAPGAQVEEESSESSSEGGAGDGSARPSRPKKHRHRQKHQHKPHMNKYDVQPSS